MANFKPAFHIMILVYLFIQKVYLVNYQMDKCWYGLAELKNYL